VELISRLSRLSSGGFESLCLRMEAPSSKKVESSRLQEASSLEGDSLPQTQAGTFKPPTQRDREKLFSSRLCAGVAYVLSRWCAGAAAYMAAGAAYALTRLYIGRVICRAVYIASRVYREWLVRRGRLYREPLIQQAAYTGEPLYSEPLIKRAAYTESGL